MEVFLAETAGFCMGVGMALKRLDELVANPEGRPIYILGPIIHNPQVLQYYEDMGVIMVDRPDQIPGGSHAVIRAHGITREVEETLRQRDVTIKDATCPRVKRAQLLINRHTRDGKMLLLYGESDHPEVAGLKSYAEDGYFVFGSPEELDGFKFEPGRKYVLAAQTTQDREQFTTIEERLVNDENLDVEVLETICDATKLRQTEARELAGKVDFMVVVGGHNSGNTRRLAQVAEGEGTPCQHVETFAELNLERLKGCTRVGVTAGASTPRELIDEVLDGLRAL